MKTKPTKPEPKGRSYASRCVEILGIYLPVDRESNRMECALIVAEDGNDELQYSVPTRQLSKKQSRAKSSFLVSTKCQRNVAKTPFSRTLRLCLTSSNFHPTFLFTEYQGLGSSGNVVQAEAQCEESKNSAQPSNQRKTGPTEIACNYPSYWNKWAGFLWSILI